jgi:anti-sigma regulatory factor (Ser/Thr protein kinase)
MKKIFYTQVKLLGEIKSHLKQVLSNLDTIHEDEIIIVINEIIQNIYRHAYKLKENQEIILEHELKNNRINFIIRDFAEHIDLSFMTQTFTPGEEGKIGVNIIKKVSERYEIKHMQEGHLTVCEIKLN